MKRKSEFFGNYIAKNDKSLLKFINEKELLLPAVCHKQPYKG
jgi:hypothetical protein